MKEDGIHENFWSMPEMPWKRKEREMDNEFKTLVLNMLMMIMLAILDLDIDKNSSRGMYEAIKDATDYIRKLG